METEHTTPRPAALPDEEPAPSADALAAEHATVDAAEAGRMTRDDLVERIAAHARAQETR
jgi:hypothetical protein